MGQIAEDMADGTCCSLCGMYFDNKEHPDQCYTHNYPVLCWDCWDDLPSSQRKRNITTDGLQRALVKTL